MTDRASRLLAEGVFLRLWGAALLVHFAKRWDEPELTCALITIVFATALHRRYARLALGAAVLVFCVQVGGFPRLANHSTLTLALNAYLIIAVAVAIATRRTRDALIDRRALFATLVVVYFWAGFHKLNRDFFDAVVSCSNWYHAKFLDSAFGYRGDIPVWLRGVSPMVAVVTELGGVALLLHRRTRAVGLLVFVGLHAYLSLAGFMDFAAVMVALMASAIPLSVFGRVDAKQRRRLERSVQLYLLIPIASSVASYFYAKVQHVSAAALEAAQGLAFVIAMVQLVAVVAWMWRQASPALAQPQRLAWALVLPVLIAIWGVFPYIGLSAAGSLTMFSNLVTEQSRSNHLLLDTRWTKLWSFEEDLVRVVAIGGRGRFDCGDDLVGHDIPRVELERRVAGWTRDGPVAATVAYRGETRTYDDLAQSPFARDGIATRLLLYRQLQTGGANRCRW